MIRQSLFQRLKTNRSQNLSVLFDLTLKLREKKAGRRFVLSAGLTKCDAI